MAIAMALPNVAWCQISSVVNDESSSDYTLRVTANLVQLNAVVMDRHKALVSGLSKDNFHIYEDNILQQIKHFSHEDAPVTVGLVIDNSGSMGPKRADLIAAALSFAHSSNPLDQIFVLNFNEHVSYGLPKGVPFTDRPDQLQLALSTIQTIGETALYDAIASALDHLKQSTCDKKVLIVISDGGDNASTHSLAQILDRSRDSSAIIYTIGIFDDQDGDQNPGPLKKLANQTGGEAFFPQSSRDITSICEGIARDIRNQYTLAYIPSISQRVGGYRRVEVKASSPDHGKLSVRTRTGYSVHAENLQTTRMVGHESHP
jgi:VWFA-related protein